MQYRIISLRAVLGALLLAAAPAFAGVPEDVGALQRQWEQIKYQVPAAQQQARFEGLVKEAYTVAARHPNSAEVLIWQAIIESTYAGAKGGLGALAHAKAAKKTLEQALAINAGALAGSAYTSLGSLYYQVPGWPLGFGDDKKAAEMLKKGLEINPDGIDPNFFYGEFMLRKGELDSAERHLRRAQLAPPRAGRQLADEGRRKEIAALLDQVAAKRK